MSDCNDLVAHYFVSGSCDYYAEIKYLFTCYLCWNSDHGKIKFVSEIIVRDGNKINWQV